MMSAIKRSAACRWMLGALLAMVLVASAPKPALADDDEPAEYDARVLSYSKTVDLNSGTTALTWVLLIVLSIVCLGVLFKDAKRTHLD
jgi:hypothetical protein